MRPGAISRVFLLRIHLEHDVNANSSARGETDDHTYAKSEESGFSRSTDISTTGFDGSFICSSSCNPSVKSKVKRNTTSHSGQLQGNSSISQDESETFELGKRGIGLVVKVADQRMLSDLQDDSNMEISKVGHGCHELCNRIDPRRTHILHGAESGRFKENYCPQGMVGVRTDYSEEFGLDQEQGDKTDF